MFTGCPRYASVHKQEFCGQTTLWKQNGIMYFLTFARKDVGDRLQVWILIWNEFKGINKFLFPLNSSENRRFSDYYMGNRN